MIISDHAKQKMLALGITDDEIMACMDHGRIELKNIVNGEMRYGKQLDVNDTSIMVIFMYRESETRVITCYKLRRKKWQ